MDCGTQTNTNMKKALLILSVIFTMMLSSCGITHHAVYNENQNQTSVVLSQANYNVVGTVTGECSQFYVLGIGGLSQKSLEQSALGEMYQNAHLTGSQAIINTNVFFRVESYVVCSKVKAIATGTVIEFEK